MEQLHANWMRVVGKDAALTAELRDPDVEAGVAE